MRHRVAGRKLNRNSSHRKALRKNLMRGLFAEFGEKGYIVTTRTKAKFVQPHAEKLITLAKSKSLHNIRQAMAILGDKAIVQKLFDEIGPYFVNRPGGYTRIVRLERPRLGDNAVVAYFGFVRDEDAAAAEQPAVAVAEE